MSLFGKKKSNGPVWRDAKGRIVCQGDNCPQECDDSCPIWLNTMAGQLIRMGEDKKALELYEKMIAMAPDFYDPWNNMGAYYGSKGNYAKARDCYAKAHDLKPERPAPVYGLALTNRDLGNYAESLKWCTLYDTMVGDHQLDDTRRICRGKLNQTTTGTDSGKKPGRNSCTQMAAELLSFGQSMGMLPTLSGFPNIPEIVVMAPQFCEEVAEGLMKLSEAGERSALTCMPSWAIIGGIGAVVEWDRNWPGLKAKGLYRTLTEPRGLDCMDEYVLHQLGIEVDTREYKELSRKFFTISAKADTLSGQYSYSNEAEKLQERLKALFLFGMVYRMCQMGMK